MLYLTRTVILLIATLSLTTACDLPQGAGEQRQILKGAGEPEATFAVELVTRDNLPNLQDWPSTGRSVTKGWIKRSRGPSGQIIEAGDTIDLSIWDNEESSLLLQPQQKVVSLKGLMVSPSGTVFLPYLDEVYIAKMTPDKARATIQDKMVSIIPSAQVQLNLTAGRESAIDLVSGVQKPGPVVLPNRDFTVMAAIAQGGGVEPDYENPQVRLVRDGELYGVSVDKLLKNPSLDTTLRGGDKVYIEEDERYFLSLGAAGKEAQFPFPDDTITALDAVSIIGGVNDNRANPKGVLILRDYGTAQVREDGTGPQKDRMIFAIDLTTADGLFSAGEFAVYDRDLVLVTESPLATTQTVMTFVASLLTVRARL